MMKNLILASVCLMMVISGFSQGASAISFVELQRTFQRPGDALKRKEDTLKKQFAAKKTRLACQIPVYPVI